MSIAIGQRIFEKNAMQEIGVCFWRGLCKPSVKRCNETNATYQIDGNPPKTTRKLRLLSLAVAVALALSAKRKHMRDAKLRKLFFLCQIDPYAHYIRSETVWGLIVWTLRGTREMESRTNDRS